MLQATGISVIVIVVAGTMVNILLLALALRLICRRYALNHASDLGPGQLRAGADVESPPLKQPKPTAVVPADNQAAMALKLTVEPLHVEGVDLDSAHDFAAEEQRHCWVVSVPLERRSKSVY